MSAVARYRVQDAVHQGPSRIRDMNRIRPRLTYANVVATICLFLVAGPSISWAAQQLGGADIRDGSLTGRDIKNGTLKAADLNASTRRALTDTSAFEKMPSGTMVTGAFNYAYKFVAGNDFHMESITLPALPSRAFAASDVNFSADGLASTIDSDASCTGSFANPTAPAGKICLYLGGEFAAIDISAFGAEYPHMRARGLFNIAWSDSPGLPVGTSNELFGSWAYRAP